MALHRQIDGVYLWELILPPATAAAVLSTVCVDLGDPRAHLVGHLLWGPKSWTIRFDGDEEFELKPLGRGNLYTIFGLPCGTIIPTKAGCRIELRPAENLRAWATVLGAAFGVLPIAAAAALLQLLAAYSLWVRLLAVAGVAGWFLFAQLWLLPREPKWLYSDFIDELFAEHILPVDANEKALAGAYHAVPPCHGK